MSPARSWLDEYLGQPKQEFVNDARDVATGQSPARRMVETTQRPELFLRAWTEWPPTMLMDAQILALTYSLIKTFDDRIKVDPRDRDNMVFLTINWAIMDTMRAQRDTIKTKVNPRPSKVPENYLTVLEVLSSARDRAITKLREEKSIPRSSLNTIYRDAEYYLVGRFKSHEVKNSGSDNAKSHGPSNVDLLIASAGYYVAQIYNVGKNVAPLVGMETRTDKDLPNAPMGGADWTYRGAMDSSLEDGQAKDTPMLAPFTGFTDSFPFAP
jgi:hypothetical protein